MKNILKKFVVSTIKFGIVFALMLVYINRFPSEYHETAENALKNILYCYIILSIVALICNVIFYMGGNKATRDLKKEQLTDIDLKKHEDYYREILSASSPLVLGYIDKFDLGMNEIIGELLYLEYNNIILIKNGKIEKKPDVLESDLTYLERLFLANIKDGKLYLGNFELFCDYFKSEIEKYSVQVEKLIKPKKGNAKKIVFLISIVIILYIIAKNTEVWVSNIVSFLFIFFLGYGIKYIYISAGGVYQRTKKGEELNQKLEGLKNYLKDYSILDEQDSNAIGLWKEYLIYSVMFGQNQRIMEEYKKLIVLETMPK